MRSHEKGAIDNPETAASFLADASPLVDVDAILRQWEAVRTRLSIDRATLPLPVWARRGFEHDGAQAWRQLSHDFPGRGNEGPMSIYIHVPFCDRRCGFCNSYSLPLGPRHRQQEEEKYVWALLHEMDNWSRIEPLGRRPVTTVHFGGGTPNSLSPAIFTRILEECRSRFGVTLQTEWALESTSSLLTADHLEQLRGGGFPRLHVGVQTLEDPVRRLIGRREAAGRVMERLAQALDRGFVVSVDVMYGLPGQTPTGLVATLEQLMAAGIHGFSVYGLYVTDRNRRFLERHGAAEREMLHDYLLFQLAEQCLVRHDYRKTHFTHFALPQDTNLYYTHPLRGEDLLALGPTADGVFGDYHYRHPEYEDYVANADLGMPALEGGVWENALERRLRPATIALMAGTLSETILRELYMDSLLDFWLKCALLEEGPERGGFTLTANGSWFVAEMLEQVAEKVAAGQ